MKNVLKDLDFLQKVAPLGKIFETNLKNQNLRARRCHALLRSSFFEKGGRSSNFPGGAASPLPLPISPLWQ